MSGRPATGPQLATSPGAMPTDVEVEVEMEMEMEQQPQSQPLLTVRSQGMLESATRRPHRRQRVAEEARRRAVRACTGCRRLKEKCNGRQPCQRCVRTGRTCEFAPAGQAGPAAQKAQQQQQQTRGPMASGRAGDGSRGASSNSTGTGTGTGTIAASQTTTADEPMRSSERVQYLEKLVAHLLGDVPTDLNNLRRIHDRISSAQRAGSGPRDAVGDLDDVALKDENFTVKTLTQSTAHYSGEFSHWNFSQRLRQRLVQFLGGEPGGRREILEYWRATQLLPSPRMAVLRGAVGGCLPPRHVAHFLAQVYFRFAQTNSFYVEERWLRARLARLYDAPGAVTSGDAAWVCAVLMVLAIGTQFAHMAEGPGDGAGVPSHSHSYSQAPPDDVGLTFYHTAARLIPDIITIASLESVQACLLLAHYALPLDTHGLAYTYLGLSIKMAVQNGLHRRCPTPADGGELDAWTVETRNRLWWTAYSVERRIGVLHGRPASIAPTEMDADLPRDLPGLCSSSPRFTNLSALIDMTVRLSDIANAIGLLRRCPKPLQPTYFERIIETWQKMQAWWALLPPDVRCPDPASPMFRPNAHLKLCFHLDQMFIGRPFIFRDGAADRSGILAASPVSTASPSHGSSSPSSSSNSSARPSRRALLVDTAVQAAYDVLALCQRLHETTGLAGASYTEFSSCRAALLLLLAQSLNESPDEYDRRSRDAIARGCRLMRAMATGRGSSVSTRSETSVVEALEHAVRRLHAERTQRAAAAAAAASSSTNMASGDPVHTTATDGPPFPSESTLPPEDELTGSVGTGRNGYEMFCAWSALVKKPGVVASDSITSSAVVGPNAAAAASDYRHHYYGHHGDPTVDPVLASFQPATFGWLPGVASSASVPQPPPMLPDTSFLSPWDAGGAGSDLGMSDIMQAFPQGMLDVLDSGWPRLE
ncbi:c6 zinc finger domain containing protein [Grosmannia clavigera kw1407]|uniref:C6 zinc finger domain containing protein n=1 Tax=Grosmannia clavigera (strain kw1407 / UAMH 11150) TaxID=655863 RepID=F0XGF8_GROCL|nr:c6 zinc finger domain containing protein [Grosmannia clavigera kw1407]EFX02989.1 c6 zinc finger domain containing protein [Grosmannia clavigera kw1407]